MKKLTISAAVVCPLVAIFALFAHITYGQQRKVELEVDGVMLHLGMTKSEVAQKFAGQEYWKVDDDNWVMSRKDSMGPSIQFTNGRLTFTERFWATSENDTGMALFGAVSSLNKDGFHTCEVTAGVNTRPDLTAHNVWISCGDKSVLVMRDTMGSHTYTLVHEELGRQHEIEK